MSDYLSLDLMFLILKPLPIDAILRCRCVCKWWKAAIDSRSFVVDHLALQRPRLLAQGEIFNYLVVDPKNFDPLFDRATAPHGVQIERFLSVVGTVHGVICLYDKVNILLLWNPSIRRLLRIPRPDVAHNPEYYKGCGFWIDPYTNEFKVAVFLFVERKIAVFSSRVRKWTEKAMETEYIGHHLGWADAQILIGGVGYVWWHSAPDDGAIVSFDFVQERFRTIEVPNWEKKLGVEYWECASKWRDCFSIVRWQYYAPHVCDLWALQDGSWSKMFSFKVSQQTFAVLYVGDDYEAVLSKNIMGHLQLYDPERAKPWTWIQSEFTITEHLYWVYDFVESLVFPDENCIIPIATV